MSAVAAQSSVPTVAAPKVQTAIEETLKFLEQTALAELPIEFVDRMHELGDRKEFLNQPERDEYRRLVDHWMNAAISKAEATVALQRFRDVLPELMAKS